VTADEAVNATPNLSGKWEKGLQALRPEDKAHIKAADTRAISGSLDLDSALKRIPQHAQANRWDFAIGYRHTDRTGECLYWVELHTANNREVDVVLSKLRWLRRWLEADGKALNSFEKDFVWVSSGATHFTLNAPQRRAFAELALRQTGGVLHIPKKRF